MLLQTNRKLVSTVVTSTAFILQAEKQKISMMYSRFEQIA